MQAAADYYFLVGGIFVLLHVGLCREWAGTDGGGNLQCQYTAAARAN